MALARIGIFNSKGAASRRGNRKVVSTSLGLIVTRPGMSAISSKPQVTRAFRLRPIHIPISKSNTFEFKSFVQTPAPRAAWEQGIGAIFELEAANDTPQPEAKSFSFAPSAVPFTT